MVLHVAIAKTSDAANEALIREGQSARPLAAENGKRRTKYQLNVEPQAAMPDVLDVEPQPIVEVDVTATAHLPQARDPRQHFQSLGVPQRISVGGERRRTRSDEAHVTEQDVEDLRQFIEA